MRKLNKKIMEELFRAGGDSGGGGYPEPTGDISITENGSHNVKDYATATVNVPKGYAVTYGAEFESKPQRNQSVNVVRGFYDVHLNGGVVAQGDYEHQEFIVVGKVTAYDADEGTGTIDVTDVYLIGTPSVLTTKTITENGQYIAELDDDADGYSEVVVDVPTGGGGDYAFTTGAEFESEPHRNQSVNVIRGFYDVQLNGGVVAQGDYEHQEFIVVGKVTAYDADEGTGTIDVTDVYLIGTPSVLTTKTITANGQYIAEIDDNADGYSEVVVDVPTGGGGDELTEAMNKTITSISNAEVKKVPKYFFEQCKSLTSVNLPNCTNIGESAFSWCTSLTDIYLPSVTSIGTSAFQRAALVTVDLPVVEESFGKEFMFCASLQSVTAGSLRSLQSQCFRGCTALKSVDILGGYTITESSTFSNCTMLDTLILRNSALVTQLEANSGLNDTKIASGNGYIYVPAAKIDEYKAATNWSTYAAQFRALEDYTVDGTTTGALDPNKI